MARRFCLIAAATLMLCGSADAASYRLRATNEPKTWTAPGRYAPDALLRVGVRVEGHELSGSHSGRCRLGFAGRGVAAQMNACGRRVRVRYVSFGAARPFVVYVNRWHGS